MLNRWGILFVMFLSRIAMGFQFQSVASIKPYLQAEFAISNAAVGFLFGLYLLPGILLAIPGGFLTKALGDMRTQLLGLGLMTLGGALAGAADSLWLIGAGRGLMGTGVILLFIVFPKTVSEWFPGKQMFFAMSLYLSGWPVGIGLALVTQPEIAATWGPAWVFLSTAIAAAAALALTAVFYRPAPGAGAPVGDAPPRRLSRGEVGLVVLTAVLWTLSNSAMAVVLAFGPGYVQSHGYNAVEAGAIVSINIWIAVVMVPLGGFVASRLAWPNAFIVVTAAVGGTALFLMTLYPSQFVLLFALMGIFLFAPAGIYVALPVEVLRQENRATGLGVFYTLWYAGMAGIPPFAGWTQDLTGVPSTAILVAAILVLAIPPMLLVFRLAERRWAPA